MKRNTGLALGAAAVVIFGATYLMRPSSKNVSQTPPIGIIQVPKLNATEESGRLAFDANCAACHGQNASGREKLGPPLVHKIYEPNHHGDAAFFLAAKNGSRQHHWNFGDMPPVEGIADAEVKKIVAYVRALQKANGIF